MIGSKAAFLSLRCLKIHLPCVSCISCVVSGNGVSRKLKRRRGPHSCVRLIQKSGPKLTLSCEPLIHVSTLSTLTTSYRSRYADPLTLAPRNSITLSLGCQRAIFTAQVIANLMDFRFTPCEEEKHSGLRRRCLRFVQRRAGSWGAGRGRARERAATKFQ